MSMAGSPKSDEEAILFRKAADYCARQEHCASEVRTKLKQWGAGAAETGKIIERLVQQGFLDEKRYAAAFARGKFRNLKWGRLKIIAELKARQLPSSFISEAMTTIAESEYRHCIADLLNKKIRSLGGYNRENRVKTMRFLAGKGFEPSLIAEVLKADENNE